MGDGQEVTDKDGDSGESLFEYVVAYDPDGGFVIGGAWIWSPRATPIYNSVPDPLPENVPSLGFQATQTNELGDYISFAGTDRSMGTVVATMSGRACQAGNWYDGTCADDADVDDAGCLHPITLNIYNVDDSGSEPALGAIIATATQGFIIPWRPGCRPLSSITITAPVKPRSPMSVFDKPPRYRSCLLTFWGERTRNPDRPVWWLGADGGFLAGRTAEQAGRTTRLGFGISLAVR